MAYHNSLHNLYSALLLHHCPTLSSNMCQSRLFWFQLSPHSQSHCIHLHLDYFSGLTCLHKFSLIIFIPIVISLIIIALFSFYLVSRHAFPFSVSYLVSRHAFPSSVSYLVSRHAFPSSVSSSFLSWVLTSFLLLSH